jgi:hypothetical protein
MCRDPARQQTGVSFKDKVVGLVPAKKMWLAVGRRRTEPNVSAHAMGISPHGQCPSTRDTEVGIFRIVQGEAAAMSAPNKRIEQTESLWLARLKRLCRHGDQGAGQSETSLGLGNRFARTADRPGEVGGFDSREYEGPCGTPPTRPVSLMSECTNRHC